MIQSKVLLQMIFSLKFREFLDTVKLVLIFVNHSHSSISKITRTYPALLIVLLFVILLSIFAHTPWHVPTHSCTCHVRTC